MSLTDDVDVVSDSEIADDEFEETTDSQQMSTSSRSQQESRAGSAGKTLIEQLRQAPKAPANCKWKIALNLPHDGKQYKPPCCLSEPKSVLCWNQPSSAAAERVFLLLSAAFSKQQELALQDYIKCYIMLQYNR